MSQVLNLVFDSKKVGFYRSQVGEVFFLEDSEINISVSFFLDNLKEIIRKNHQHNELIRIYFNPVKYTLIPASLFLPSKIDDYFRINFGATSTDELIQYESILTLGTVLIYSLPTWLITLKSEINGFGDVKTILGRNLTRINDHKSMNLINCTIRHDKMDVLVKSNGKLLLANQYDVQNEEDIVYFLLLIVQKLSLPISTTLELTCNSTKIDLDRFQTISASIQELSIISLEIVENKTYFNSILCV